MKASGRSSSFDEPRVIARCLAAGIAVGLLVPRTAPAGIIRVPQDYATINAAITAASPGDTVLVAAGVYSEFETRPTPL